MTVNRGERGGNFRGKGWRVCRNNYKGQMDINREGGNRMEVGRAGGSAGGGGKGRELYLNKIRGKIF